MQPTLRQDDFMERAMRTWGSTVYRLALNQTQSPHDAEDICQDVFLRLLKDATAFKDDEHLKAWLLCVAINRCRDLHRSAWKRRAELTDAVPDAGREDPRSDDAARALQDSELGRALGRLPDKMRLIVHLHYYEGFSTEEIARLVECWGKAAIRAREAGFDAVEIHGAHGYLISQFLSPYTNRRTDGYGGSLENRMRFALEVCRKVRESVGPDFPVTYRMSAVEGLPGGTTLEDSVALAKRLVADGIDALHVSVGLRETNFMVSPPACVEKGWNAPLSRAVRDGIEAAVPVIVAGRVADEQTAQGIIDRGDADMVAMGRALIADPFLPAKVAAGEAGDIIRCVGCNEGCVAGSARGTGVGCALNPLSGAEGKYDLNPVVSPKKVAVIGGGPAGMQAALAARFRGHTVDLYEKSDRLGGLLNVACKPPHKEDLGHVTGWFERQLKRAGVGLHLGAALTPEAVRDLGADAVIAATGSAPVFPGFCRKARNAVVAQSILSGEAKAGEKALVIGGGLIGCETAEFLAAQGSDVTILELQPELAKDMESRTRRYLMQRLREYGTRFLTSTQVLEVTEEGKVKAKFPSGSERWLDDFDTLVIAVGYRAENALAAELEEMGCPCVRVGDCASVGKILTAIESGFQAGCSIK